MTTASEGRAHGSPPRPGTVHPHLARERALKVLFQADVRGVDARQVLDRVETTRGALELLDELEPDEQQVAADAELRHELTRRGRLPLDDYTRRLVGGVAAHRRSIDEVLEDVAEHWRVERMPVVDRNLLRLAVYELALEDTPAAVVIDEAVSLAGGFAGDRARPFVNGVLETVRRRVATGEVHLAADPAPGVGEDAGAERTPPGGARGAVRPETVPGGAAGGRPAGPDTATDDDPGSAAWDAALDLLAGLDEDGSLDDEATVGSSDRDPTRGEPGDDVLDRPATTSLSDVDDDLVGSEDDTPG